MPHPSASSDPATPSNPQKLRKGFTRVFYALRYSCEGLKAGWQEAAFRQESIAAVILSPAAFWLGTSWIEIAVLLACLVLVLVVELLNTGIESAIDRIGDDWHALAKKAKDVGSAAVLLTLLLCAGVWGAALIHRLDWI